MANSILCGQHYQIGWWPVQRLLIQQLSFALANMCTQRYGKICEVNKVWDGRVSTFLWYGVRHKENNPIKVTLAYFKSCRHICKSDVCFVLLCAIVTLLSEIKVCVKYVHWALSEPREVCVKYVQIPKQSIVDLICFRIHFICIIHVKCLTCKLISRHMHFPLDLWDNYYKPLYDTSNEIETIEFF